MIDMVICTFKRLDKQITLSKIPESYRDNVTLVVQPQEANDAKKIHKNIDNDQLEKNAERSKKFTGKASSCAYCALSIMLYLILN